MPQTLSEIKAILAFRGLRPRRGWGQNFLHDHAKLDQILQHAQITPGESILEVGPGTGVLTERLLEAGASVTAVEIDRNFQEILRERIGPDRPGWRLICGDVLASKRELNPEILDALGGTAAPFKLIANLPYQIASPLLANLASDWLSLSMAVVMVQKEVADRLTAGPGGRDYGPLGILIQAMMETQIVMKLPPGCFWPAPEVDSAVVKMTRRPTPLTTRPHALGELLHQLFSKRRKQIGAILGREAWLPEGVDSRARPEELTIQQLIELAERPSPL